MENPRVLQDGIVLPETPLRAAFASTDTFNQVPIISGVNRDEMKLFYLFNDRLTKTKFGKFIVARDQDLYDAASDYASRIWRIRAVDRPFKMMTQAGHEDIYAYRFDWDEGGKALWMDLSKILGAAHSIEIPFVMNRFKLLGEADPIMFKNKTLKTRNVLSRSMGSYWANFARSGKPGSEELPAWPAYGQDASVLYLDSTNDGGIRAQAGEDNLVKIMTELKADPRVDRAEKCEIAQSMVDWVPTLQRELDALIDCEFTN